MIDYAKALGLSISYNGKKSLFYLGKGAEFTCWAFKEKFPEFFFDTDLLPNLGRNNMRKYMQNLRKVTDYAKKD